MDDHNRILFLSLLFTVICSLVTGLNPEQMSVVLNDIPESEDYVQFLNVPQTLTKTMSLVTKYRCKKRSIVGLELQIKLESGTQKNVFKSMWVCEGNSELKTHKNDIILADSIVYQPNYFNKYSALIKSAKLRVALLEEVKWRLVPHRDLMYDLAEAKVSYLIHVQPPYSRPLKPIRDCVRWPYLFLSQLSAKKILKCPYEDETVKILDYPIALNGLNFGLFHTFKPYNNLNLEKIRLTEINEPRLTVSMWMYVLEYCTGSITNLCSIMYHFDWKNDYLSPLLFLTVEGKIHVQMIMKNGRSEANLTPFKLPLHQWFRLVFSIASNKWSITINYGEQWKNKLEVDHQFNTDIRYNDVEGIFSFGGSEYVPAFKGYFGQVTFYRHHVVSPRKEDDLSKMNENIILLKQSACTGHTDSMYMLSVILANGIYVKADPTQSHSFLLLASMKGHRLASLALANKYYYGLDAVPRQIGVAYMYFKYVADKTRQDREDHKGTDVLTESVRLNDDIMVKEQTDENGDIFNWLKHQAKQGVLSAQLHIGRALYWGAQGLKRNMESAMEYFRESAATQDPTAMYDYGIVLLRKNPQALNALGWYALAKQKNYKLAAEYFEKSHIMGNADASYHLGHMYFSGIFPGQVANVDKAYEFFVWAALKGQLEAGVMVAYQSIRGTSTQLATFYYMMAAEAGIEVGTFNVAWLCEENKKGFVSFIARECQWRNYNLSTLREFQFVDPYALLKMGDYNWYGCGGKQDLTKATQFYMGAASKGSPHGIFSLAQMVEEGVQLKETDLKRLGLPLEVGKSNISLIFELYNRCKESHNTEAYIPCSIALWKVQMLYVWKHYHLWMKVSSLLGLTLVTAGLVYNLIKSYQQIDSAGNMFQFLMLLCFAAQLSNGLTDEACDLPVDQGKCEDPPTERWYFDAKSKTCKKFKFTCGGNRNNFLSNEECIGVCTNVCTLPVEYGRGYTSLRRYYFNKKVNKCEEFDFSGDGGNTHMTASFSVKVS
ncbi:protein sel-1 homolog 3-like [Octopus vulgaris]|uniref:Protein sel-1 homolog 3-like n=1 Tax=Octopus vulgaris TaxID=6645 RepID=A0AA36F3N9_OCTVU|nr:protein sel-1 homolog 3-like [Octopus vulgaris]